MSWIFCAVVLLPLLAASLVATGPTRALLWRLLPWLPLPALLLASQVRDAGVDIPWLMLGARWQLDTLRSPFLLAASLLWGIAGLHARACLAGGGRERWFLSCWCLALAGNLWLIVAGDAVGFYAGFALMTFAAWGLVVHADSARALWAGKVYIGMALLGELALLAGLLLVSEMAGGSVLLAEMATALGRSEQPGLALGLLLGGFGVKAGLPLLHFWLPLAHPVAPTPASAVLSGAMIKAGLLGWLVTLPLGMVSLSAWGTLVMALGLIALLGAAFRGIWTREAKTVLAWSSISQMGLATLMLGAILVEPALWWQVSAWFGLFVLHHGFAKGALFLSVSLPLPATPASRHLALLLLALPALPVIGLPLTSGETVKGWLKNSVSGDIAGAVPWQPWLPDLLSFSTLLTLLLLLRWWWLLRSAGGSVAPAVLPWAAWLLLSLLSLGLPLYARTFL